ncbi:hypothetical protein OROMI_015259 [Orobanche minor]
MQMGRIGRISQKKRAATELKIGVESLESTRSGGDLSLKDLQEVSLLACLLVTEAVQLVLPAGLECLIVGMAAATGMISPWELLWMPLSSGPLEGSQFTGFLLGENVASKLSLKEMRHIRRNYDIPDHIALHVPSKEVRADWDLPGMTCLYELPFKLGFQFPLPRLIWEVCDFYEIAPGQLVPNAWRLLMALEVFCEMREIPITIKKVRSAYALKPTNADKGKFQLNVVSLGWRLLVRWGRIGYPIEPLRESINNWIEWQGRIGRISQKKRAATELKIGVESLESTRSGGDLSLKDLQEVSLLACLLVTEAVQLVLPAGLECLIVGMAAATGMISPWELLWMPLSSGPLEGSQFTGFLLGENVASKLSLKEMRHIRRNYDIPDHIALHVPSKEVRADWDLPGMTCLYELPFKLGFQFPLPRLIWEVCDFYEIAPGQLVPNAWRLLMALEVFCEMREIPITIKKVRSAYALKPTNADKVRWGRIGYPIEPLRESIKNWIEYFGRVGRLSQEKRAATELKIGVESLESTRSGGDLSLKDLQEFSVVISMSSRNRGGSVGSSSRAGVSCSGDGGCDWDDIPMGVVMDAIEFTGFLLGENVASKLSLKEMRHIRRNYDIPDHIALHVPSKEVRADWDLPGMTCLYELPFKLGFRFPLPRLIREVCDFYEIAPRQLVPNVWRLLMALEVFCEMREIPITIKEVRSAYALKPTNADKGRFQLNNGLVTLLTH